jgi:hypothetical protein
MARPERAQARISASRTFAYIASMAATHIAAVCGDSTASAHRRAGEPGDSRRQAGARVGCPHVVM